VVRAWPFVLLLAACGAQPKIVFRPNPDGSPIAPIILDPKPNAVIVNLRPPITLAVPPGTGVAHVEICNDDKCESVLTSFDTMTERTPTPVDLPSGVYWLRASARVGQRYGRTGPIQRLAVEVRTKVTTAHFDIDGPADSAAALRDLGELSESLLAFYESYLGVKVPARLTLSYFATADGYHVATNALDANKLSEHAGFTHGYHSFIRWNARVDRAPVHGVGGLEHTTAHELVHQLQAVRPAFLYRLPPWLSEASADLLAEIALASIYKIPEDKLVSFLGRYEAMRKSKNEGYAIPVTLFFDAKPDAWQRTEQRSVGLFYSEGYTILRSVAAPAARMQEFLRDLWARGANVDVYVRSRTRALFGDDATLQHALDGWLAAAISPVYRANRVDARLQPDGTIYLQTARGRTGGLRFVDPLKPGTSIEVDAELVANKTQLVIEFGGVEPPGGIARAGSFTVLTDGPLVLLRPPGGRAITKRIEPLSAGRHRFRVALANDDVAAYIDEVEVARLPMKVEAGVAGLAIHNCALHVHSLTASVRP
jgi:hypothetical protein